MFMNFSTLSWSEAHAVWNSALVLVGLRAALSLSLEPIQK